MSIHPFLQVGPDRQHRLAMRSWLIAVVMFAILPGCNDSAAPIGGATTAADPRPNLLLLVAEDLGPRIGAFGDTVAVTPHIDRLARDGVRFPNTFTAAGVCAPSRAALVTGVHPNALGAGGMRTSTRPAGAYRAVPPPEVKAFPELLRASGYYTFTDTKLDYQFSGVMSGSGPFTIWSDEGFRTSWRNRPEGTPFFGMINFMVTHESSLFERSGLPTSALELLHAWLMRGHDPVVSPEDVEIPPYYPDVPVVRETLARFYDQIHRMDEQVGEILARLEADGLLESTIIVFTTDHGDGLPRHKREVHDSGTRVPLIIHWPESFRPPGTVQGGVDERLVSFVDLAPTLLAWAGLSIPEFLNGQIFAGPEVAAPRRHVFAARDRIDEQPDRVRSVRDERFRYVRNFNPTIPASEGSEFRDGLAIMRELERLFDAGELSATASRWFEPRSEEELYDTKADPHEVRNLAADPEHRETLLRLRAELDAWSRRVPDLGAIAEDELVERFWPGGTAPQTEAPQAKILSRTSEAALVSLVSATEGASIGWRLGSGPWQVYRAPFEVAPGTRLSARAVRYGWDESDEVRLVVD